MGFKKQRLGPRLVEAARSGDRYSDAHMFLGGTGAVGGTAVLQMLGMYEEMFAIHPPGPEEVPLLVATGTTSDEIEAFTRRLFRFVESRHGHDRLPRRIRSGYLTASGVFIALERFEVTALPGLRRIGQTPPEDRGAVAAEFLRSIGTDRDDEPETIFKALAVAVASARPFSAFLDGYRARHLEPLGLDRYRSVLVGIPIPSLVAYHQDELLLVAEHVPGLGADQVNELKEGFVGALRDDLVEVQQRLAKSVLMAHTTGVGGMYDDSPSGHPAIRLGFAHSGLDRRLAEKQRYADTLTRLYAGAGVKVLITAAAIGIDEVRVRERIPLHREIRQKLFDAPGEVFPGSKASQPTGSRASRQAGRPVPARQVLRTYRPLTVPLDDPPSGPATFERGEDLLPSYVIRSGENGFFSVGNADALYRVMRVASAGELGLMLATVALLGDDPLSPWFEGGVCYYTETDNARHVLDFLSQPALLRTQLSGLEPVALQDLGSAKHQAEMHTLALLILLHRLRTLDVDAIDPSVDVERFEAAGFFVERSRTLTFEDLAVLDLETLIEDMQVLAGAEAPEDLLPLMPLRKHGLFPQKREALRRILERVLHAVWIPPSLGSPLVFERDGRSYVRSGFYVAPLDLLVTERDGISRALRSGHRESGNPCAYEDYRDYHLCVGGFIDVRPHAIACTAKSDREDLSGAIARFRDVEGLRAHLARIEPYGFFATCGLLAVFFRLRALYDLLNEAMIELGTLHDFRWHMPRDAGGHILMVPGVVESLRMVSEGLEKTTGAERLDGIWGYERRPIPDRREAIVRGLRDRNGQGAP
ncbi:hypothetical protein BH20ACT24_BH20ACT24_16780 [soil metagenome]